MAIFSSGGARETTTGSLLGPVKPVIDVLAKNVYCIQRLKQPRPQKKELLLQCKMPMHWFRGFKANFVNMNF